MDFRYTYSTSHESKEDETKRIISKVAYKIQSHKSYYCDTLGKENFGHD